MQVYKYTIHGSSGIISFVQFAGYVLHQLVQDFVYVTVMDVVYEHQI